MRLTELLTTAFKHWSPRSRRAWISESTAHIEYGVLAADEIVGFRRALGEVLGKRRRIRWFEVNPHTHRVVICFEAGGFELAELVDLVESAERLSGNHGQLYDQEAPEHPADVEPIERLLIELFADSLGLLIGLGLRFSPVPRSRIAGSTAALMAVLRATPRLRRSLDERYGFQRMDLSLSVLGSLAQGAAQRPLSCLVEIAQKTALLREAQARHGVWLKREAELCQGPSHHAEERMLGEPRPCPLPPGPIEQYADRAWAVALGGFAISFITTRSVQRAGAALFGSLPKPARLGRDVFSAHLGRELSERGVLIVNDEAFRRLDRVDCLVLQGGLVARGRYRFGRVATRSDWTEQQARTRVSELFDADNPVSVRRSADVDLGPIPLLGVDVDPELSRASQEISAAGGLVLGLSRNRALLAVVEVQVIPQTGINELIQAAHDAQMRVVIASDDPEVLQGLPADDTIPEADGMRRGVRRLQREGRCVCLVAAGPCAGLAAADCSIGLLREGQPPPWGAHIICEADLTVVRFILHGCIFARRVAKQSVNVALAAASVGALVSAGGLLPLTGRRVITVVNLASLVAMANGWRSSSRLSRTALPEPRDPTPWHALDPDGVLKRLGSSRAGLSHNVALSRSTQPDKPPSSLLEFGSAVTDELFNPLAPLLAAGAGLSALVGSLGDAAMVGGVVVLNALVGGTQRFRTERAIRDLSRTTGPLAHVKRDGRHFDVPASDLVIGDLVFLSSGDEVPADCRVLDTKVLEVDASSLTGESLPVRKSSAASFEQQVADRSSMLYQGTSIASGEATAVVVAVGEDTIARRGGAAAARSSTASGVEKRLQSLINLTAPVALLAGGGLVAAGLLRGRRLEDLVGTGVSLAVASVPEGLPLLATAAQLSAADRLSRRGALVRNVRSIEALGRVDVLCVDKTGTVTEGRIELSRVFDGEQEQAFTQLTGKRLRVMAQALRATPERSLHRKKFDPTDSALQRAAEHLALTRSYARGGWRQLSEHPFEAARGFHVVLGDSEKGRLISVKGAPEALLPKCSEIELSGRRVPLTEELRQKLAAEATQLAKQGLRVLAVAEADNVGEHVDLERLGALRFCGHIAFSDPVRPAAKAALERLRRAKVRTIMITGDHPSTAEAIASELGLLREGDVITGAELSRMNDELLDLAISRLAVFARVTPAQKMRVVRALQRTGHVVAMAGDGSNDAPAIRLADVGIAVGGMSTTAARGAADIVLTDERIETLVDAITEGRAMWASVRDAVSILVGGNLGEVAFTVTGGLFDGRPPLVARQLLLVNLLTDVAPAMAIALRPPDADTLQGLAEEGPDLSLGQPLNRDIASRALVTTLGAGGAWIVGRLTGTRARASTIGLVALVGTQLGQTLVSGRMSRPVLVTSIASSAALAAIVQTPGLSRVFGCRPLGPFGWGTAIAASVLATGGSVVVPRYVKGKLGELKLRYARPVVDPEALVEKAPVEPELGS